MPIISAEDFTPTKRFKNGHYNTFIPALFYWSPDVQYRRQRYETPDDDFLDVDFLEGGHSRAIYLLHGLEGNSESGYMLHFADYFARQGYDIICPIYRSCSGEMNRQLRMYNSGTTDDVDFIIKQTCDAYDEIHLAGFSLGGNLTLKYLGERAYVLPEQLKSGISISAPVDLSNASQELLKPQNFAYQLRFLSTLHRKAIAKKKQYPNELDISMLWRTYNLYQYDDRITAQLYGYKDAEDYYAQNASLQYLESLERPAILINAADDPFLGDNCYPTDIARSSSELFFCHPDHGGHVGFAADQKDRSWVLDKAKFFLDEVVSQVWI